MFTGLIETTGKVVSRTAGSGATRVVVEAQALAGRWKTGDSIAVNGVCLTAIPVEDATQFAADLATETLERTTLRLLAAGTVVNLELPTPAGSPLGGHVVQGHVDGMATLVSLFALQADVSTSDWRLTVALPEHLAAQVVAQGSITLDGISLTVAKVDFPRVEIAVIPHTYAATNLHTLRPGDWINVETDVLAKYAAKANGSADVWLTSDYLLQNGY